MTRESAVCNRESEVSNRPSSKPSRNEALKAVSCPDKGLQNRVQGRGICDSGLGFLS